MPVAPTGYSKAPLQVVVNKLILIEPSEEASDKFAFWGVANRAGNK